MFCCYCGKKIPDDARFCSSCGKPTQGPKPTLYTKEQIAQLTERVQERLGRKYSYSEYKTDFFSFIKYLQDDELALDLFVESTEAMIHETGEEEAFAQFMNPKREDLTLLLDKRHALFLSLMQNQESVDTFYGKLEEFSFSSIRREREMDWLRKLLLEDESVSKKLKRDLQ